MLSGEVNLDSKVYVDFIEASYKPKLNRPIRTPINIPAEDFFHELLASLNNYRREYNRTNFFELLKTFSLRPFDGGDDGNRVWIINNLKKICPESAKQCEDQWNENIKTLYAIEHPPEGSRINFPITDEKALSLLLDDLNKKISEWTDPMRKAWRDEFERTQALEKSAALEALTQMDATALSDEAMRVLVLSFQDRIKLVADFNEDDPDRSKDFAQEVVASYKEQLEQLKNKTTAEIKESLVQNVEQQYQNQSENIDAILETLARGYAFNLLSKVNFAHFNPRPDSGEPSQPDSNANSYYSFHRLVRLALFSSNMLEAFKKTFETEFSKCCKMRSKDIMAFKKIHAEYTEAAVLSAFKKMRIRKNPTLVFPYNLSLSEFEEQVALADLDFHWKNSILLDFESTIKETIKDPDIFQALKKTYMEKWQDFLIENKQDILFLTEVVKTCNKNPTILINIAGCCNAELRDVRIAALSYLRPILPKQCYNELLNALKKDTGEEHILIPSPPKEPKSGGILNRFRRSKSESETAKTNKLEEKTAPTNPIAAFRDRLVESSTTKDKGKEQVKFDEAEEESKTTTTPSSKDSKPASPYPTRNLSVFPPKAMRHKSAREMREHHHKDEYLTPFGVLPSHKTEKKDKLKKNKPKKLRKQRSGYHPLITVDSENKSSSKEQSFYSAEEASKGSSSPPKAALSDNSIFCKRDTRLTRTQGTPNLKNLSRSSHG